jgi:hypothetical protein
MKLAVGCLQIAHIAYEEGGPFPGVFIATTPARMIRPVLQLSSGKVEMIGPLEQVSLLEISSYLVDRVLQVCSRHSKRLQASTSVYNGVLDWGCVQELGL